MDRLLAAASYPIVLVIAPPGFGKSTAIQQLMETRQRGIQISTPHGATIGKFVESFGQGCSELIPEMSDLPFEVLADARNQPTLVDLYSAWAAAHLRGSACTIVVDDLQHADQDPAVATFLTKLADLLKGDVQWVFSSRTRGNLPITRWQAYADADSTIGADDLKMTYDEALALASSLKCSIPPSQLRAWVDQTQGFPVPLAYAIRVASRQPLAANIMDGAEALRFSYLAEHLWESLSQSQRAVLECAAYLPPLRIQSYENAGLTNAARDISRLCNDVAFLSLDRDGRFCMHDLFRDFTKEMISRSGPQQQRAAIDAAVLVARQSGDHNVALNLLLDWNRVVEISTLIEELGDGPVDLAIRHRVVAATEKGVPADFGFEMLCIHSEYWSWFGEPRKTLLYANELIRRDAARSRHLVSAIRAISRVANFESDERHLAWLTRLPTLFSRLDPTDALLAKAYQAAFEARHDGGRLRTIELVAAVRDEIHLLDLPARIEADIAVGAALFYLGDYAAAIEANFDAVSTASSIDDPRELARSLNNYGLMLLYAFDERVEEIFIPLQNVVERTGSWRFSHVSHWLQAHYHAQKGNLAAAEAALNLRVAVLPREQSQRARFLFLRRHSENLCRLIAGSVFDIITDFGKAAFPAESDSGYELAIDSAAAYAMAGNAADARPLLQRAKTLRESLPPLQFGNVRPAVVLEIIALCAIGRWQDARRLFERIKGTASNLAALDAALARFCDGPPFVGAAEAVAACKGRPYMGLAALLIERLLERAPAAKNGVQLTPTEVEVLRLLGSGKSNKEIAALRARSIDTVKRQVTHVYNKLGVENRTAAVAIARERGLL